MDVFGHTDTSIDTLISILVIFAKPDCLSSSPFLPSSPSTSPFPERVVRRIIPFVSIFPAGTRRARPARTFDLRGSCWCDAARRKTGGSIGWFRYLKMGFGLVGADGDGVGRGTLRALRIKDGLAISTSKSDGNKPFYRRDLKKKKNQKKRRPQYLATGRILLCTLASLFPCPFPGTLNIDTLVLHTVWVSLRRWVKSSVDRDGAWSGRKFIALN